MPRLIFYQLFFILSFLHSLIAKISKQNQTNKPNATPYAMPHPIHYRHVGHAQRTNITNKTNKQLKVWSTQWLEQCSLFSLLSFLFYFIAHLSTRVVLMPQYGQTGTEGHTVPELFLTFWLCQPISLCFTVTNRVIGQILGRLSRGPRLVHLCRAMVVHAAIGPIERHRGWTRKTEGRQGRVDEN